LSKRARKKIAEEILSEDSGMTPEQIREHHREANAFMDFIFSPEHQPRPRETHWQEDLKALTEPAEEEAESQEGGEQEDG
jgi:hypothetical protein